MDREDEGGAFLHSTTATLSSASASSILSTLTLVGGGGGDGDEDDEWETIDAAGNPSLLLPASAKLLLSTATGAAEAAPSAPASSTVLRHPPAPPLARPAPSLSGLTVGQWEAHAALAGVDVSRTQIQKLKRGGGDGGSAAGSLSSLLPTARVGAGAAGGPGADPDEDDIQDS